MFAGRRPGLHSFQGVLPPLPLPPLHDTVQRAVASLQALGPGGGRERVPALARSFLGGPGPRLQRWLRLRAWALPSYLSDLWEEHVHLGVRSPLPTTSNYYLMDLRGPPPTRIPAARAANAVFALLQFRRLVLRGELPPALFRGTLPTCSAQYERLFNTTRLPGESRDRLRHGGGGAHVAVLHAGRLFRVPVRRGGRALRPRELQSQFERAPLGAGAGGAAGGGEGQRGGAAGAGGSPFLVALDPPPGDGAPPGDPPADGALDAEAKALLHGPCHNRWFDKSLTLVVFASGRVGLNAEHSWGDPPVVGRLWEYTLATDVLALGYEGSGDCRGGVEPGIPPPQRLHWDIPPECRGALAGALGAARALAADLQLHVFACAPPPGTPPGPPDALVQLALQLALVRERGPCLSYQPVPTRLFLEGRAEAARGCGPPVLELAAAMGDPKAGRGRRRALLGAALRQQRGQRRAAMTGAGLDRHLQALAAVAAQLRLRPPFLAEAHPDGYGVCYARGGDAAIIFHVSCKASSPRTDARRFAAQIRAALGELGELLGGDEE
ncbi:carnitine O-palmitoyltransferase 1, liver isoform-like [Ciconia boyciana]|uniref:carnitine O-palmitoyltransferase 1, liver isoform-like n=1 Tax=Ciconia boyciana TaxID=52775 RepID=UPI003BA33548